MTKKKRIMISLEPEMIKFIDSVCEKFNRQPDTRPEDRLTRSRFLALCVLAFGASEVNQQTQQTTTGE